MKPYKLVLIGASAGGPRTLKEIFTDTPRLNGSIIIVQHMPQFVNTAFCESLNSVTDLQVKIAENSESLRSGTVYLAPSSMHMSLINNMAIRLYSGEKVNFVCPSIDVTMKSVTRDEGTNTMGVILTGMGKDGAEGIRHLKNIKAVTVAQNEDTSIVYGMPHEAVLTGCIDYQLSPDQIRNKIISFLGILRERI